MLVGQPFLRLDWFFYLKNISGTFAGMNHFYNFLNSSSALL